MSIDLPPTRTPLSPDRPYAVVDELEPDSRGGRVSTTTVFLTASRCPVGCHMCDLWQNTLPNATEQGAIPNQIDWALASDGRAPDGRTSDGRSDWIKLYNSGNFFDARSIPPSDYEAIARRCSRFSRVVVENHPKIGKDRIKRFRDALDAKLEIAVGLETVQPRWLRRMGKQMTRDDFDRYAVWLRESGIDLRVFLIIGVPGTSVLESFRWARLSLRHAISFGARHISLIPARSGHGWNGRSASLPTLSTDDLAEIQRLAIGDAQGRSVVTVDLWDVKAESKTNSDTVERIRQINLSQRGGAT